MPNSNDRRSMERIAWESWVTVKDADTGQTHNGILYNFNSEGIYFECDARFKSGSALSVSIENLPDGSRPEIIDAEVKWAEEIIAPVVMFHYGVGASYAHLVDGAGPKKGLTVIHGGSDRMSKD